MGLYKSQFLKNKIIIQNENRKKKKKAQPAGSSLGQTNAGAAAAKGKVPVKGKMAPETEETLLDQIEELKSDLKIRDQEFEEMRKRMAELEKQNAELVRRMREQNLSKFTIEAKLQKIVTLKELEHNYTAIEKNTFFEERNSKIQSLNTNLMGSVNEQYKSSLRNHYVAKYA